jgi:FtsP/CotA-like multicopper oxidase with cupredoxin domain
MAALLLSSGCAHAQDTAVSKAPPATLLRIEANPNLSPAGKLRDGVLTIRLEIRAGDWYPEAETGPSVVVQAFAEEGRPLQIPGPLIRVPEGTEVRATVRNVLEKGTARVYGLHGRPGDGKKPIEIPAGEIREVRFKLRA